MFQSYELQHADPSQSADRVLRLRQRLCRENLDGFVVPLCDEHQGEYIAEHAQRLRWLTGFTGSAGLALILHDKAVIFTDGRYTIQLRQQTDPDIFCYCDSAQTSLLQWLEGYKQPLKLGIDPWLHTIAASKKLRDVIENKCSGQLIFVEHNLVDQIWHDQPEKPLKPVDLQTLKLAGERAQDKIARTQQQITQNAADFLILTDPTSIAWLFNIRGRDVEHTPIALSFAILTPHDKPQLFIEQQKLSPQLADDLAKIIQICPANQFISTIQKYAKTGKKFAVDPLLVAEKIGATILQHQGSLVELSDPISLPRAIKNTTELNGARAAHWRDGLALIRFLAWLDQQPLKATTEISAAQQLEHLRATTAQQHGTKLEDIAFDTISASGAHGAIIHYRVTKQSNKTLDHGELYLIDSGAQYRDGTTDLTRTIAIGDVSYREKHCFTLVLKGMIALSMARFPKGTRGCDLDVLARHALWHAGLDYAHGTGHGVGSYLAVHEGPQSISRRSFQPLIPGMIVSNEPGYYSEGSFGIRIENLMIVSPARAVADGDHEMLSFETLTQCPIDQRLIVKELLNTDERLWLNNYHATVEQNYIDKITSQEKRWLKNATRPL